MKCPLQTLSANTFPPAKTKDRNAVESLLTKDFIFTSPYDHRIDRETYFKRCWPYSEKSPMYGIEKVFEKGNEAFVLIQLPDQEWRLQEYGILHHRRKQDETR